MTAEQGCEWRIEVFFDGACPLCLREIRMLRWMDRRQRIRFSDIADPAFRPAAYGMTMNEFMDEIRGRYPDGTWIVGVEVFRQLYTAVGLGAIVWFTRLPIVRHALEWGYRVFAKNRLRLTGRCHSDSCQAG
ncbi:MAG: DUF393 domain-containing protein [Planctomycetota bacterium]